jgi:hypothetical protein
MCQVKVACANNILLFNHAKEYNTVHNYERGTAYRFYPPTQNAEEYVHKAGLAHALNLSSLLLAYIASPSYHVIDAETDLNAL